MSEAPVRTKTYRTVVEQISYVEVEPTINEDAQDQIAAALPTPGTLPPAKGARTADLIQWRVQPTEVAEWATQVVDGAHFVFGCPRGQIAGAILRIARNHADELAELLQQWAGVPEDQIKAMVWAQMKATTLG